MTSPYDNCLSSPTEATMSNDAALTDEQRARKLTAEIKELVREKPTSANAYGLRVWEAIEKKIVDALAAHPGQSDADQASASECPIDFGPGATLKPGYEQGKRLGSAGDKCF
jgi:hypothetical protein